MFKFVIMKRTWLSHQIYQIYHSSWEWKIVLLQGECPRTPLIQENFLTCSLTIYYKHLLGMLVQKWVTGKQIKLPFSSFSTFLVIVLNIYSKNIALIPHSIAIKFIVICYRSLPYNIIQNCVASAPKIIQKHTLLLL